MTLILRVTMTLAAIPVFLAIGGLSINEYQAGDGTTKQSMELNATVIDLVGKRGESAEPKQDKPAQPAAGPAEPRGGEDWSDDIPFTSLNAYIRNHLI